MVKTRLLHLCGFASRQYQQTLDKTINERKQLVLAEVENLITGTKGSGI